MSSSLLSIGSLPASGKDRWARLRAAIGEDSKILEVGGSYNPIAPRSKGYNSFSLDYATKEYLIGQYTGQGVNTANIEHVDFVCPDGDFESAVDPVHLGTFDVIVSSHNIEHYQNPIRMLRALSKFMKPNGVLTMAVPDHRGCFDFFRPITTTGAWLEAFINKSERHNLRSIFEKEAYAVALNGIITWGQNQSLENFSFASKGLKAAYELMQASSTEYVDTHASVFTPSSFLLILLELYALDLTDLAPVAIDSDHGVEFYVDLRKEKREPISDQDRMALLKRLVREQAEVYARVS